MPQSKLEPKLLTVLREGYTKEQFIKDLSAGVIVGIVALPLAIAFAIASGVKPEQGLYTAIVAGFLISCFSGSRVQIGGPTGAFIVIVYGIVQQHGYAGLAVATLLAGLLLMVMGLARLGTVIKYIPYPVTVGFTAGIALIIAAGQLRDFLGLQMSSVPAAFIEKWVAYGAHLHTFNPYAVGVGLLTVMIVVYWPRLTHRVPGSLIALLVTTALVHLGNLPVETIGSRFGAVPNTLPKPVFPAISWEALPELFSPALTIALLAGIESLLSAVVADGMTGRRHRSNMELIAQGIANVFSPIFGGIPATGAIARTATNVKNGGRTPIAGMIHALVLLLIMLFFGKWAALVPMATLAGILLVVAYNMSEWHLFVKLFRGPKSDVLVLLATFLLTVLVDLTVAIQVGVVLAALLFMRRMAEVTQMSYVTRSLLEEEEEEDPNPLRTRFIPEGVEVFEVNGPFFFGAADKFKDALRQVEKPPRVLILRLRKVLSLDATGLMALEDLLDRTRREGTVLILSGVHAQPLVVMQRSGFLNRVGEENVFGNIDDALNRAYAVLGLPARERPPDAVPEVRREQATATPAH
ncbi:SulP family inorganic anion transporter [Rhodothermus bifroesti]|uniref:SulP family inorganic anion transporter n=1 Tax=Rhodothermus bifroesti TaxID=2823335 RepID=UPI001AEFCE3B|nr:sulfate permease [Rhodothermus bifroesti]